MERISSDRRLVLIDGHALVHRAYHAMPELTTSSGERVEAIYGFLRMLLRVIKDLNPTHLIVSFDLPEPTFRNKMFPDYQAHRPPTEEAMKAQLARLREVVGSMNIPVFEKAGYEADDMIGTLSRQAVRDGLETYIVTGDRDILQLVQGDRVNVCLPKRGISNLVVWNEERFREKYGFEPEKLVEYKGLVGDPSDNYPGVRGIGDKTAKKLLMDHDSVEEIYQDLENIEDRYKNKLIEGKESAFMSRDLAQIVTNIPISVDWDDAVLDDFRTVATMQKFKELEFGSLLRKFYDYGENGADDAESEKSGEVHDDEEDGSSSQMSLL